MTHRPLVEALAVTVGNASCCMPVSFRMSCSHVFENGLAVWVWENVTFVRGRIGERLFYIVCVWLLFCGV